MSWVSYEKFKTVMETVASKFSGYLPLTGGTVTGSLNVPAPTADTNATTKKYVDEAIAGADHSKYVLKAGDTMTGALTTPNLLVKYNAQDSASGMITLVHKDIQTSLYFDEGANSPAFYTEGEGFGFMNGEIGLIPITIGEPLSDSNAATKKYVDDAVEGATGQLSNTYVKKSGDTMTGQLTIKDSQLYIEKDNLSAFISYATLALKRDEDVTRLLMIENGDRASFETSRAEFEFRGFNSLEEKPILVADPTKDSHAATKKYVDTNSVAVSAEMSDDELAEITAIFE